MPMPMHTTGGPRSIGGLVSRLLARTGYDQEQATSALAEAWEKVAPAAFKGRSQAGLVRRGVLEVHVSHSALVQEMGFHKREILARLAESVPGEGITDIRCRVLPDAGRPTPSTERES
jgi:hypothetical protein